MNVKVEQFGKKSVLCALRNSSTTLTFYNQFKKTRAYLIQNKSGFQNSDINNSQCWEIKKCHKFVLAFLRGTLNKVLTFEQQFQRKLIAISYTLHFYLYSHFENVPQLWQYTINFK